MSILVTGAGGFVGLNLLETLLQQGKHVVALNDRPLHPVALGRFDSLPGKLDVVTADVRERGLFGAVLGDHHVECVVHAAAITLGPKSAIAPAADAIDVNVVASASLLDAAIRAGVGRFVYPSSSAVYGEAAFGEEPVTEDSATAPAALYGFTKLAGERFVVSRAREIETVRARITALFGPWEHDTGVRETLSPPFQVAKAAMAGGEVVLADRGHRDWTSSRDIARALAVLALAPSLPGDCYNLSLGRTWRPDLLCTALERVIPGLRWRIDPDPGAANVAYNDDLSRRRVPVCASRFERDFSFRFMSPEDAAADYAGWAITHGRAFLGTPTTQQGE